MAQPKGDREDLQSMAKTFGWSWNRAGQLLVRASCPEADMELRFNRRRELIGVVRSDGVSLGGEVNRLELPGRAIGFMNAHWQH